MNVAVLLKGAISKTTGRSNLPGGSDRPGNFVNYKSCYNSIIQHIVKANPSHSFDFFIHTWHPELQQELVELYSPKSYLFESNDIYTQELLNKIHSCGAPVQDFGQVSHCLSIKRVTDLLEQYVTKSETQYDRTIFYRLDVLLWKDIILEQYSQDTIYCNHCTNQNGDFHFVMNYHNALLFGNIYNSISIDNPPTPHEVMGQYILNFMHKPLEMDDILAGRDQEVIRKLGMQLSDGRLVPERISQYGIYPQEILTYQLGDW